MGEVIDVSIFHNSVTIRFDCGCEASDEQYYPNINWCIEHQQMRDEALSKVKND